MVAFNRRRARPSAHAGRKPAPTRRRAPPSAALIDVVLEYADLRDDMGGGRVMLRLSPARMAEPRVRKSLGADAARAGDVAVIWDEREDCIFRVLDGSPPPLAVVERPALSEDDQFVLTPAALEYIAQSQSRGRG